VTLVLSLKQLLGAIGILAGIGGLIGFGKYVSGAVQWLYARSQTKKGQAALHVGTFVVCLAILLVVLLRR
jgi:hypothetical protein